jgi:tryptophanyl-tRNA synthetase
VPRILSGIQPTGDMHLGNYVGAVRRWAELQHEHEALHPVVDLHAITLPYDQTTLEERTLTVAALLFAAGLDPDVATVFVQSHVPEHTELNWLLNSIATVGELRRQTQFKAKAAQGEEGALPAGYFNYPVLQAADILVYQADLVPVGEDQRQHLELARDVALRFNHRFGETFTVPAAHFGEVGARIMDLQHPENKMSKSADSPMGTILVLDEPAAIQKKIRSAVTDSDPERRIVAAPDKPAITNLLSILSVATGKPVGELEAAYAGRGYGDLKRDLADAVVSFLTPVRERYHELRGDPERLAGILEIGAAKAQAMARDTLATVKDRMGLLPRRAG